MYTGRTKKWVEALAREGRENFDVQKWLRQVKEEEAQENRIAAASNSRGPTTPEANDVAKVAQIPIAPRSLPQVAEVNNLPTSRNAEAGTGSPNTEPPKKKRLGQRLADVANAWDEFRETRDRDAVYEYLRAVFSIVQRYRWKDRTKRLIRRAFKFAGLPIDMNAEPFAVVIQCTCDQQLDRKTVSKWSRVLRYAAQFKKRTPLKTFIKNRGGINACATLYAERIGRSKR